MPFDGKSKYFSGGRSADSERLRRECRKVTEKVVRAWIEALEASKTWTDSKGVEHSEPDHDIRIKAANALADRGYGKPAQEVTATVEVNGAEPDDIHSKVAAILAVATGGTDAGPTGEPH